MSKETREEAIARRAAALAERKAKNAALDAQRAKAAAERKAELRDRSAKIDAEFKARNQEVQENLKVSTEDVRDAIGDLKSTINEVAGELGVDVEVALKDSLLKAPLGADKRAQIREDSDGDKKVEKTLLKAAKKEEKERVIAERLELFGEMILDQMFWARRICIYEKGFVSVRMLTGTFKFDKPERLISIDSESHIVDKQVWTENKIGDLYLTIVTERETYALNNPMPDTMDVRTMKAIVATGQSVIGNWARGRELPQAEPAAPVESQIDLSEQLKKVSELHKAGLLSDEEFAAAKAKLLGM